MPAYSTEGSLLEGHSEVKKLFEFIEDSAASMDAYTLEQNIFFKILAIGLLTKKGYFAEIRYGDVGAFLELEDGTVLKRPTSISDRS